MANSTLAAIRAKVRNITRTPSEDQLTTSQLDEYINTFIQYDFPSNLRLFSLRTIFSFYTKPFVDRYDTNTTDASSEFFNFKNKYISVHQPVFLAGIQGFYTQNREIFYGYYPQTNTVANIVPVGNGTAGPYTGTLSARPIMQSNAQTNVTFSTTDINGNTMVLRDYPLTESLGLLGLPNIPETVSPSPYGQINYITGQYTLFFPQPVLASAPISSSTIPYQPGKPIAMLYYDDQFIIRPVPDKSYIINIEADVRPTELLNASEVPELEQWWQYIAFGASRLYFQDTSNYDSLNLIEPMFKEQESKVLRTTLMQQANERTITIYTQGKNYGFGWFGPGGWPY